MQRLDAEPIAGNEQLLIAGIPDWPAPGSEDTELGVTIRGGGDPPYPHGFRTALKNGPAAPELRCDAHECIMVVILTDQPNTRLRGKSAPDRELPSELSSAARTTSSDQYSLPPRS